MFAMAAKPLNSYRENLYLSMEEFARHLNISTQTLYRILKGERPRPSTMRRIAAKLGVHPSDISEFEIKHDEPASEQ
jgi:transcriptional regulator with XRE-family HTH domain